MTQQEIWDAWAPVESEWSQWVKPVLFAHLPDVGVGVGVGTSEAPVTDETPASNLPRSDGATALVLDLPNGLGAQMALVLAYAKYRPIPLYNSCPPPKSWKYSAASTSPVDSVRHSAVEVQPILDAII